MKLFNVMYHYVRDVENTKYPRIYARGVKQFENQLDYMQKTGKIISFPDALKMINLEEKAYPGTYYTLTFDDNLIDHYKNVYPLLKERGLTGNFFVMTDIVENRPNYIQQAHILQSNADRIQLIKELDYLTKREYNKELYDYTYKSTYSYDTVPEVGRFKHVLNYEIPFEQREGIANELCETLIKGYNSKEFVKETYMDWSMIKEMSYNGQVIGSHSHTHPQLSFCNDSEIRQELQESKRILEVKLRKNIDILCYPFGLDKAISPSVQRIAKETGYKCGIATLNPNIKYSTIGDNPYKIWRIDTNEIPCEK